MLWVHVNTEASITSAFIYDFLIDKDMRGQGYGMQTMQALEGWLRQRSVESISLHVFASNKPALKLYEKVGFEITGLNMRKVLAK